MEIANSGLSLVYRHRVSVGGLGWSRSGNILRCILSNGEANEWSVTGGTPTTFNLSKGNTADDHADGPYAASCDAADDDLVVATPRGELQYLDSARQVLFEHHGVFTWKLRSCPTDRRVAFIVHAGDSGEWHRIGVVSPTISESITYLVSEPRSILDFAWAPNGKQVAILHRSYVRVVGGAGLDPSFTVPGSPQHITWTEGNRIALGCADSNIRVYEIAWPDAKNFFATLEAPRVHLVGMLEQHEFGITGLTPTNGFGLFASLDESGSVHVWDTALHLRFSYQQQRNADADAGLSSDSYIAIHPTLAKVAIDVDRSLCELACEPLLPLPVSATDLIPQEPALAGVLARAGLSGARKPNSDDVMNHWRFHEQSDNDIDVRRVHTLRKIADTLTTLAASAAVAVRELWPDVDPKILVALESIGLSKSREPYTVYDVRRQILSLLLQEIDTGDQPRVRIAATGAYVAIGSLGIKEATAAFAKDASIQSSLQYFETDLRHVILQATVLFENPTEPQVLDQLENAKAAIHRVLHDLTIRRDSERISTSQNSIVRNTREAILLIHGIRTQAEWTTQVREIFESSSRFQVIPTRYGFFDLIRFLLPIQRIRLKPVSRIETLARDTFSLDDVDSVSVIAHSFGTWIVAKILERSPDIKFRRIILCGSIIPDDFAWEKYTAQYGDSTRESGYVVNDCGLRDLWPVLALSVTWGYGSSGRFGFGHSRVRDRFHAVGHSGFFKDKFAARYWLPFLSDGVIIEGELGRPATSWWVSALTTFKLRYVLVALFIVGSMILARPYARPFFIPQSRAEEMFKNGLKTPQRNFRLGATYSEINNLLESPYQNLTWANLVKDPEEYHGEDVRYFFVPLNDLPSVKAELLPRDGSHGRCLDKDSYVAFNFLQETLFHITIRMPKDGTLCAEDEYDWLLDDLFGKGIRDTSINGAAGRTFVTVVHRNSGTADGRKYRTIDICRSGVLKDDSDCISH